MPLGYDMVTLQHTVSGAVFEVYARASGEFLDHPWFSQFYVIYNPGGYGVGPYGSGPYGNE